MPDNLPPGYAITRFMQNQRYLQQPRGEGDPNHQPLPSGWYLDPGALDEARGYSSNVPNSGTVWPTPSMPTPPAAATPPAVAPIEAPAPGAGPGAPAAPPSPYAALEQQLQRLLAGQGGGGGGGGGIPRYTPMTMGDVQPPDNERVRQLFEAARPPPGRAPDHRAAAEAGFLGALAGINIQPGMGIGYGLGGALRGGVNAYAGNLADQLKKHDEREAESRAFNRDRAGLEATLQGQEYSRRVDARRFDQAERHFSTQTMLQAAQLAQSSAASNRAYGAQLLGLQIRLAEAKARGDNAALTYATAYGQGVPQIMAGKLEPPVNFTVMMGDREVQWPVARQMAEAEVRASIQRDPNLRALSITDRNLVPRMSQQLLTTKMLETIQRWQSTNDPRFMEFGQFLAHSHRISRASRQATLADETP